MHACLFDIDGTLIQSGGAGMEALRLAMLDSFEIAEPNCQVEVHGRTDRAIISDLFLSNGVAPTEENWNRFQTRYLEFLPAQLQTRTGQVLPGVFDLLAWMSARKDIFLGLLTGNCRAGALLKLRHFKLDTFFNADETGEPWGFGDTHFSRNDVAGDAWRAIRAKSEFAGPISQVWVIGDTPADVECGRSIGARVIAVATGKHSAAALRQSNPDFVVPDLSSPHDWQTFWGSH